MSGRRTKFYFPDFTRKEEIISVSQVSLLFLLASAVNRIAVSYIMVPPSLLLASLCFLLILFHYYIVYTAFMRKETKDIHNNMCEMKQPDQATTIIQHSPPLDCLLLSVVTFRIIVKHGTAKCTTVLHGTESSENWWQRNGIWDPSFSSFLLLRQWCMNTREKRKGFHAY